MELVGLSSEVIVDGPSKVIVGLTNVRDVSTFSLEKFYI